MKVSSRPKKATSVAGPGRDERKHSKMEIEQPVCPFLVSLMAQMVKNPPANAGDSVSIPGSGRSFGVGNGNPLQYFYLGNPMDGGAWRATVHGGCKEPGVTEHTHA